MEQIDLFKVFMADTAAEEVTKVLNSGYIGQGKKVDEFEKNLKDFFDNGYVVTLNSGTSALHLALHMLKKADGEWPGLTSEDEVLTSALSCTATNFPIVMNGLKIKWVDIDPETLNMDLDDLERKITAKTKVIMVVHWGGYPNDLDRLKKIQERCFDIHGFIPVIIEDGAHSMGSKFNGKLLGNHGNMVMYSLQAIKHMTSIDGGLLILPNSDLYNRAKLQRWYGIDREGKRSDFRCLYKNTLVRFADGSTRMIKDVVENKIDKPIMVYDNGRWVSAKIKKWIKSELGNRTLISISTDRTTNIFYTIVTNDHKILTENRGWVNADELKNGEKILTSYPKANNLQTPFLIGSLLGDGHLRSKTDGRTAVFQEGHSPKQHDYLLYKKKALDSLGINVVYVKPNKKQNLPYGKYQLYSNSSPYLGELSQLFYKNKERIIPRKFVKDNFSMFSLAIWFMDDGCTYVKNSINGLTYYSEIATNAYDKSDVDWLVKFLKYLGYECSAKTHGNENKRNKGYRIFFTMRSTHKLLEDIAEYVPNSMRYKVGHRTDVKEFNPKHFEMGSPVGYYDKCMVNKVKKHGANIVYCLKTDNDNAPNFMAGGICVHNCETDIIEYGSKFHLNDICATVGIENFKHADRIINLHKSNAKFYDDNLQIISGLQTLTRHENRESAFWIYSMLVERRADFMKYMKECGIVVSQVHERNDKHTCMREFLSPLPTLDKTIGRVISIPVGWWVTEEQRQYIVDCIKKGW